MYYQVKVKVKIEDEKGKIKKVTEVFLVDAVSVTDAESIVVKEEFSADGIDREVISVTETKILKVY
jgi:hypothetical protein